MRELQLIKDFYGDGKAIRSGVPFINHIYEGVMILEVLGASLDAMKAFCLHPIIQNGEEKKLNLDLSWSSGLALAQEYEQKANAYLCRIENDWVKTISDVQKVVGNMSEQCRLMLLADKYQNRKDFVIYHQATHPRSKQLTEYFNLWIKFLNQTN
jgi:hypothetical protein